MQNLETQLGELGFAGDDMVVPFQVDALDVRGRTVQLGPLLDTMLARHAYPEPVARLLAEAVVLTALIGTSLKFEGKFPVQTKGDGPIDFIVADFKTDVKGRGINVRRHTTPLPVTVVQAPSTSSSAFRDPTRRSRVPISAASSTGGPERATTSWRTSLGTSTRPTT